MLKVLLADDEYFITQGLIQLIDWYAEGYKIVFVASNGMEALDYLKKNQVDLIIADIKMPIMSGLDLLETIRTEEISNAHFVILSGYNEFAYAKRAMHFDCMEYLLKPIQREELLTILRKINDMSESARKDMENQKRLEEAYLARNVVSLLGGKYDEMSLKSIQNQMQLSEGVRYIDITCFDIENEEEGQIRNLQKKMYLTCQEVLKEDESHCIFDVSQDLSGYDVGLIYCDYMAEKMQCTEQEYLINLHHLIEEKMQRKVCFLVGEKVTDITMISRSYGTIAIMKMDGLRKEKAIAVYEEEIQMRAVGVYLYKKCLDNLISSIEQNDQNGIQSNVDALFEEMKENNAVGDVKNLNINYLLFQLIHLATELDSEVNQEEILKMISAGIFEGGILRGNSRHFINFACEYGEYLQQLRKKVSTSVFQDIEKEIREHYAENLTLRDLGKRYYINSSYLGQIFRKKYGMSFKDYLSAYRINEASLLLLKTDMKINDIAEQVGYKDSDYFIRKFIEQKGCTPSKFRRQKS